MKSLEEFKASLKKDNPNAHVSAQLKALWYDAKGDWTKAHDQVDHLNDRSAAWVHAYLHRKEGDLWNADYWYRNAKQTRPNLSLDLEWEELVMAFL